MSAKRSSGAVQSPVSAVKQAPLVGQRGGELVAQLGRHEREVDHVAELVHDVDVAVELAVAVEVGEVEAHLVLAVGATCCAVPTAPPLGLAEGADRDHAVDVVDQLARLGAGLVDGAEDPLAVAAA